MSGFGQTAAIRCVRAELITIRRRNNRDPRPLRGSAGWSCVKVLLTFDPTTPEARSRSVVVLVDLADVMLSVELDSEVADEAELRFKEVDMRFLVVHQLFEQIARDIVLD